MKKSQLAFAILAAFAGAASAQSNVTIGGIVDVGVNRESGGANGSVTKLSSGIGSVSRLIFRGNEDLGSGLSAVFKLESGFKADTGEQDVSGSLFNREAWVGLKSTTAGTVTLGRQYTPWYSTIGQVADPFGTGFAGNAKNLMPTAGNQTRTSNTVLYSAPVTSGFMADFAYGAGEQAGDSKAGRQFGGAVGYGNGPFNVRFAYNNRNSDVAATGTTPAVRRSTGTNKLLAANYDFKVVKAFAAWGIDKGFNSAPIPVANAYGGVAPTASLDSTTGLLGLTAPIAGGTLMSSYLRKDDKTRFNQDAHQWGVGYVYPLSKRTNVYTAYAKITNKNGAGYTVGNNGEAGSGDSAFNLGLRHSF